MSFNKYTKEEMEYITENWGYVSLKGMATKLGRKPSAIKYKAYKMGLGAMVENKDYLLASEVIDILGTERKTFNKYIEKKGMRHKRKKLNKREFITIQYTELVDWLMTNSEEWNSIKADNESLLAIGLDREFLIAKIKRDKIKEARTTINKIEIEKIKKLYKKFYTYEEIAETLGKEYGTVKWKIHTMIKSGELVQNTKEGRLVRRINRDNYGWQEWQDRLLITEFKNGKTLKEIAEMVDKSLSATKTRNQVLTKRIIKGMVI